MIDAMTELPNAAEPTLRVADLRDLAQLTRLAREFYDEDGFATGDVELDRNLRVLLADRLAARIGIAALEHFPIGFALTTTRVVLESGVVAELQDLYVMPGYRRRGVAAALMDDAAVWARTRGASLLEVVVAPNGRDVSNLFRFYRSRGYHDEGRHLLSLRL
jgi:aminoglycoside 6'-N-acetyltransferase I